MPAVNLYLSDEDYELYKKLGRGRASYLFSQAIKEDTGTIESLERVNKRIDLVKEEINQKQQGLSFLESKKALLEEREKDILAQKERQEAKQREKILDTLKVLSDFFKDITGRDMAESDAQFYLSNFKDIKQYLEYLKDPESHESSS